MAELVPDEILSRGLRGSWWIVGNVLLVLELRWKLYEESELELLVVLDRLFTDVVSRGEKVIIPIINILQMTRFFTC